MGVVRSVTALLMVCALVGNAAARGRVVVVETSVEILEPIRFVGTTATITVASTRMLDAIARSLDGNPSIKKLEVIAYGNDARISPLAQIGLGDRRAKAIVNELILRGVEPTRLVSTGALHPERSNDPVPIFLILKRSSDQ
jgi:outer membrane protein OmpA-like peptidoglycan-associated protein